MSQMTYTAIYNVTDLFLEFALERVSGEAVHNVLQNFIVTLSQHSLTDTEEEAFEQSIKDMAEHREDINRFMWKLKIESAIERLVGAPLPKASNKFEWVFVELAEVKN